MRRICLIVCAVSLLLPWKGQAQQKTTYREQILPLVETHCAKCHNTDKKKGDLDLTTYNSVLKGGGSGQVVSAGNPDASKLYKAITHVEDPKMPPSRPKLPDSELSVFRKWIAEGLLEHSGSKAQAASPAMDIGLKSAPLGKPEGPPPMPKDFPLEPVAHTSRVKTITALAASPWAPLLAIGGTKQVLLFHFDSLEPLGILPFPAGEPVVLRFSRNGNLLLAGGGVGAKSGQAVVWEVATGKVAGKYGRELDTVQAVDLSPDQTQLALGGPDKLVKLYSCKTTELTSKLKKHTDWITAVAVSPAGDLLASGDRNGGITLWDAANAQEVLSLTGHKAGVTALCWRDDGKILASASEDGAITWWEPGEGKAVKTWSAHPGGALWIDYAHDGRLVSCGRDNQVAMWKADGSKERPLEFSGELPLRVVFSHDGKRVAGGDFAGRVLIWDAASGKQVGELDPNPLPLKDQIATLSTNLPGLEKHATETQATAKAAEAAWLKAQTNATSAQQKLAELKSQLARLEGARRASEVFYARERLTEHHQQHTALTEDIKSKAAASLQASNALAAAQAATTQNQELLAKIAEELRQLRAQAETLVKQMEADSAQLKGLTNAPGTTHVSAR
jgi:hypothetical protein